MVRCGNAGMGGVIGPRPALAQVVQVAEWVKSLFPARRAGIERLAAVQLYAGDDKMQLMVPRVAVPHPEDVALVSVQCLIAKILRIIMRRIFAGSFAKKRGFSLTHGGYAAAKPLRVL